MRIRSLTSLTLLALAVAGCATKPVARPEPPPTPPAESAVTAPVIPSSPPAPVQVPPPRIALVLGGGAAKGFAHIGVIKSLEAQGIKPDLVVGTSVGSLVATLYASGYDGFDLQRIAMDMKESMVSDWSLPDRGILKGEALQEFVNKTVQGRPLEKLSRKVAVVATDLQSGDPIVFERGDAGMAVRASSSVPGVFQPVRISGREYVDGGLVSPVPVKAARNLGADFVIAVDIASKPSGKQIQGTLDVLLQTFTIMGATIAASELQQADVVIKPDISKLSSTDFQSRHLAILEGERATQSIIPDIRRKLAEREDKLRATLSAAKQPR
jgi:NTE family protein